MWWILGGKFSVRFTLKKKLKLCHRELHHFLLRKSGNFHLELTLGAFSPKKGGASLFLPRSHKNAAAHM